MLENDAFSLSKRLVTRVLVMENANPDEKGGSLLHRGARVSTVKRISEVASDLGHRVVSATAPIAIDDAAPEVVLVDALARDVGDVLQSIRANKITAEVFIIAIYSAKSREEVLETLRLNGADEFLSADASRHEIQTRLAIGGELFRARAEIVHVRENLNLQTRVDDLTGVMSRRYFFQQSHRECSRARRYGKKLSCLMLEINHFKLLCSNLGDAIGEQVLRSTATIIGQWTRDSDLVSRFADAKFAILLPETPIEGATSAREKIQTALREHRWSHDGQVLPITISIGEAEFHEGTAFRRNSDDWSSDEEGSDVPLSTRDALAGLLEDADAALYIARKSARVPEMFVAYTPAGDLNAQVLPRPSRV